MEDLRNWLVEKKAERTIKGLRSRGFRAEYFDSPEEAATWLLEEAKDASFIGAGGSVTVRQLGVLDILEKQGKTIFDHWSTNDPQESMRIRRAQLTCDLFLSSANALTESGEIVNMDATGNRVSAMAFGPRKIIIVAGINKIVPDLTYAYDRIREVAAPLNAKRLGLKAPCAKAGHCTDCDGPQRICNVSVVMHRKPPAADMAIALIGEELGC